MSGIDNSGEHPSQQAHPSGGPEPEGLRMIVLGVILLVLGFLLGISILWTLGIILVVVGVVLYLLGTTGRVVGGRKHWY